MPKRLDADSKAFVVLKLIIKNRSGSAVRGIEKRTGFDRDEVLEALEHLEDSGFIKRGGSSTMGPIYHAN